MRSSSYRFSVTAGERYDIFDVVDNCGNVWIMNLDFVTAQRFKDICQTIYLRGLHDRKGALRPVHLDRLNYRMVQ